MGNPVPTARSDDDSWDITEGVGQAVELMTRYGGCTPGQDDDDVAPRTVFVEGHLVR
jgi:hypothetical protein